MTCVILQPSFIPWRGYFHQIKRADVFVFYDDVLYDAGGWRNRNRIKTTTGLQWLTIPLVSRKDRHFTTLLNKVQIASYTDFRHKHLNTIRHAYARAPFFREYYPLIEEVYHYDTDSLVEFTINATLKLGSALCIPNTQFLRSSLISARGSKTERLLHILKEVGASHYISGPSAKAYLDERLLTDAGISVEYMSYEYPEYAQLHPPFISEVSVIDLLFMTGPNAAQYIWPKP